MVFLASAGCCFFFKISGILSVSNNLDLDQARRSVGPDLGPNCLQRLSADDTSRQMGKGGHQIPSNINRESKKKKSFVVKVEIISNTLDHRAA